ncbi:hypothetical protein Btru_073156 [Bulinus truncatus]|nr:hypothetical protein Btru_073156 [Bulinus truncatus]
MEGFSLGDKPDPESRDLSYQDVQPTSDSSEKNIKPVGMQYDLDIKFGSCDDVPRGETLDANSVSVSDLGMSDSSSDESNDDGDTTNSLTFIEELDLYGTSQKTNTKFQDSNHVKSLVEDDGILNFMLVPVVENKKDLEIKIERNQYVSLNLLNSFQRENNDVSKLAIDQKDHLYQSSGSNDKTKQTTNADLVQENDKPGLMINEDYSSSLSSDLSFSMPNYSKFPIQAKATYESKSVKSNLVNTDIEISRITKEFTVVPVKEADLPSDKKVATVLNVADKKPDTTSTSLLLQRPGSTLSEGEINNQDTIGPLENPAFLRKLQYTESHINAVAPSKQDGTNTAVSNVDLISQRGSLEIPDVDQGWAWVILASSFFSFTLLGATAYAAGVFMSAILKEINPDLTKVAWVGSVNVCFTYLTGPFVGVVLDKLGARLTVSLAGILVSLGFIGAAFSTCVGHLILTHGVLAGVGAGYTLNPMFVTIGQYFDKYRGIACGLLACGTGIGILTGGSFVSFLLEIYGLRGTYLIWAGLMLHIAPAGMFLRPSYWERMKRKNRAKNANRDLCEPLIHNQHTVSGGNSLISFVHSFETSKNHSMVSVIDKTGFAKKDAPKNYDLDPSLLKTVLTKQALSSSLLVGHQIQVLPLLTKSSKSNYKRHVSHHHSSTNSINVSSCQSPLNGPLSNAPRYSPQNYRRLSEITLPASALTPNFVPSPMSLRAQLMLQQSSRYHRGTQSHCTSMTHINKYRSAQGRQSSLNIADRDDLSIASTIASKFHKKDISTPRHLYRSGSATTFMGSIMSVPAALAIVNEDLSKYETKSINESQYKSLKEHSAGFSSSLHIFRKKIFLIFIIVCFFWAIGESPVIIYLPSFAIDHGTSAIRASSLYIAMGTGSILGRFLSSMVAIDRDIGFRPLFTICLFLAGALIVACPVVTSTFIHQMIFSGLLGLYTGSLVPLSSLIILDMLEANELGAGVGFLSLFQGVGYLIGPPLASFVINSVGYSKCFIASGFILIFSSVGSVPLSTQKSSSYEIDDQLSLTDELHEYHDSDLQNEFYATPDSKLPTFGAIKENSSSQTIDKGDIRIKQSDISVRDFSETAPSKELDDKLKCEFLEH